MTVIPMNQAENIYAMAGTFDMRESVDTTRHTKAVYIVDSGNVTGEVPNSVAGGTCTARVGGQFYPWRVNAALTGYTGYDVVYCY